MFIPIAIELRSIPTPKEVNVAVTLQYQGLNRVFGRDIQKCAFGAWFGGASAAEHDELRSRLRIGLHHDVEVTDRDEHDRQIVAQAFCSALPVAYSSVPAAEWQPFAELVLEAAYEATLRAAVVNAQRGASNIVLLTRLGGGAFGNDDAWIDRALQRALLLAGGHALDVRLVQYGAAKS